MNKYFLPSSNKASNNIERKSIVSKFLIYLHLQLMFLKIIHKLEANDLCCYTESIGRSFNNLYFCPEFLIIRNKVYCEVSRLSKAEQSKISDIIVTSETYESIKQPTNWVSKVATLKAAFL